jgi:hypothetical protein
MHHLAGLDLAVGVIPFVGALVASYAFFRYGARKEVVIFAAVAISVTFWLLLEVGVLADFVSRGPAAEVQRIHERYLFYLVPLFLIALLAAVRLPASRAPFRVYEEAAVVAAALPALIPFRSVINNTIVADSFSLQPYGKAVGDTIVPVAHTTLAAVCVASVRIDLCLARSRPWVSLFSSCSSSCSCPPSSGQGWLEPPEGPRRLFCRPTGTGSTERIRAVTSP